MKIILYMAMSLNGFIANENGDEDFLSDINWKEFEKLAKKNKGIILGRKTYERVMKWKDYNFDSIKTATKIIVSKNKGIKLPKGYYLASSPNKAIQIAKSNRLKTILLAGGSKLNSAFIKANLINEIIINVNPVILGRGISLFSEEKFQVKLKLIKIKKLSEEIIQVNYKII